MAPKKSLKSANTRLRSSGVIRLLVSMQELEAVQLNQAKAHTKLVEVVEGLGGKVNNLTIPVDRLVERDLGRSSGEM
ncbi:MAG TPA: hypothetical protein VGK48_04245 [Terriglobia bacterium]